jgi:hypothetical protein
VDDRDKGLTHLFVRDLDEIPLPPRGDWRRAPGKGSTAMRASRGLLAVGAVAAVVAVALIVGYQLNQRQENVAGPSVSPRPSPSVTSLPVEVRPSPTANPNVTPTPAASASRVATGIYNDDFGFLVANRDTPGEFIRKESGGTPLGGIPSVTVAVSPDGTQLAFFVPDVDAGKLRIAPASDPNNARTVATLGAGEHGIAVAWSNDASGLLYAIGVQKADGTIESGKVHLFDMRGTTTPDRVIYEETQAGVVLWPIAWDRAANIAAFGETGEGGFMASYDVVNLTGGTNVTRSKVPVRITMGSVKVSSDSKFVVAQDLDANGFTYWPLQTMSGAGHHPPESKYGVNGFAWRPGTHEIGFIGPSNQFWVCDVDKDNSFGCGHTLFSGVPDGANVRFFRADGSGVVLALPTAPGPGPTKFVLVRIGTDPKSTSGDRVSFDSDFLLGSVRLR